MTRGTVTPQQIVRTGLDNALAAASAAGDEFANDGRIFLHVKNGSGAPINVTIATPGQVDGLAVADLVVAVPATDERMIGPFPTNIYNQADGKVYVDYSAVTTVTVAAYSL